MPNPINTLISRSKRWRRPADSLRISVRTVEVHRARVFEKMGVKSAPDLSNLLREHGLPG